MLQRKHFIKHFIGLLSAVFFCVGMAGCDRQAAAKTLSADTQSKLQQQAQANKPLPAQQEKKKAAGEVEEPPMPPVSSPHLDAWQSLLHKFYQNECAIKEKLRHIFTREKERQLCQLYLPDLFTANFYGWFEQRILPLWVADPPFPVGVPKVYQIESESDSGAVVAIRIRGKVSKNDRPVYQFYRLRMLREEGQWRVDSEEEVTSSRLVNVSEAIERNVLGHLAMRKTITLPTPTIKAQTPQQLFETLIAITQYVQNERNKIVNAILPELVTMLKPYVTSRYYKNIAQRLENNNAGIQMQIKQFTKMASPPEDFAKLGPQEECWELIIDTIKVPGGDPFRPYHYYFVLRQEDKLWKFQMEAAERNLRLPNPGPLLANLLAWSL